jgi:hypothetical protein
MFKSVSVPGSKLAQGGPPGKLHPVELSIPALIPNPPRSRKALSCMLIFWVEELVLEV